MQTSSLRRKSFSWPLFPSPSPVPPQSHTMGYIELGHSSKTPSLYLILLSQNWIKFGHELIGWWDSYPCLQVSILWLQMLNPPPPPPPQKKQKRKALQDHICQYKWIFRFSNYPLSMSFSCQTQPKWYALVGNKKDNITLSIGLAKLRVW